MNKKKITFEECCFGDPYHCTRLAELISEYALDPMGNGKRFTKLEQLHLIDGIEKHPAKLILFALIKNKIVGVVVGFVNFSTFNLRPYINIHDIVVQKEFRENGIGRKLLQEVQAISVSKKYCKITLEVRHDNIIAKELYTSEGYTECSTPMYFWNKILE